MATPFTLHVPGAALQDLQDRLARTRFADTPPATSLPTQDPWSLGTPPGALHDLVAYWRDSFDWRAQEAALNAFPQLTAPIDTPDGPIQVHALHVPGRGPNPTPLLLCHGWPGSVFEFLDIIPRLTDPARFGADPAHSFTVIAPSLPGYGLSFTPGQPRLGIEEMAEILASLMTGLGYPRFMTQGGDFGAFTTTRLAFRYPERVIGLHLNMLPVARDTTPPADATPDDRARYAARDAWLRDETGYQSIQGTKPQTLAAALMDSPAGLAAWHLEKFHSWSDHHGDHGTAVPHDRMLANIALYWFTGAVASSFHPYHTRLHRPWIVPPGHTVDVPMAYAEFPAEMLHPPRAAAAAVFTDIRRWTEMPHGGHFAALEQPEALALDLTAFRAMLPI